MNKLIAILLLGTFAAWVLSSGIAQADEAAEGKIRTITPTEAISDCIGDLSTPLCAVKTLIGCNSYVRIKGCKKINFGNSEKRQIRIEYIIVKTGFVDPELVAEAKYEKFPSEFGSFPWLNPGQFQARIKERNCSVEKKSCKDAPWLDVEYTVSNHGAYWDWAADGIFDPRNWFVKE